MGRHRGLLALPITIIVCETCLHTKSNHIHPDQYSFGIEAKNNYCVGYEDCDCIEYI